MFNAALSVRGTCYLGRRIIGSWGRGGDGAFQLWPVLEANGAMTQYIALLTLMVWGIVLCNRVHSLGFHFV
eukprot:CAMPEP_0173467676 /NCGR_PEP_ID=MMETSP1357-20121228/75502_1 /TAXON_ID=77926 /ORGANISM="Hemiselmis rufescens, Strain PCC563" /LENGTH=70 /DNA_ID=CAMNT_0014435827 /DNA_START=232 /DNA_END=441 /DNA_ORIENTATION=+